MLEEFREPNYSSFPQGCPQCSNAGFSPLEGRLKDAPLLCEIVASDQTRRSGGISDW